MVPFLLASSCFEFDLHVDPEAQWWVKVTPGFQTGLSPLCPDCFPWKLLLASDHHLGKFPNLYCQPLIFIFCGRSAIALFIYVLICDSVKSLDWMSHAGWDQSLPTAWRTEGPTMGQHPEAGGPAQHPELPLVPLTAFPVGSVRAEDVMITHRHSSL